MKTIPASVVAALLMAFAVGCSGGTTEGGKSTAEKLYDVTGKVVAINPAKSEMTLDHEDIPGLMRAMKMDFKVADAKLLEGLQAGDAIQGKLRKDAGGFTLTKIEKR